MQYDQCMTHSTVRAIRETTDPMHSLAGWWLAVSAAVDLQVQLKKQLKSESGSYVTSLKTVNLMCGTVALKRLSMEEVKNMRTRVFYIYCMQSWVVTDYM